MRAQGLVCHACGSVRYGATFSSFWNRPVSIAGRIVDESVPRPLISAPIFAIATLSAASMNVTKSYSPRMAYCCEMRPPSARTRAFTSARRPGFASMVLRASGRSFVRTT